MQTGAFPQTLMRVFSLIDSFRLRLLLLLAALLGLLSLRGVSLGERRPGSGSGFRQMGALLRRAQRFVVGVRDAWIAKLADARVITPHDSGLWLLANPDAYSPEKGLSFDAAGFAAETLML